MQPELHRDYAMTLEEIGAELGISKQNVYMTLRRALVKIRRNRAAAERFRELVMARSEIREKGGLS